MPAIPLVVANFNSDAEPLGAVLDALSLDQTDRSSPLAVLTNVSQARLVTDVLSRLAERGHHADLVSPPTGGIVSRFAAGWTRIPARDTDAQFPEISMMRSLAPPRRVLIVQDSQAGDVLPVDQLSRYVHPRLAAAVRFSRPDLGAAADVALGFNVAGVLLAAALNGRQILAATPDLVAGQLLALAFQALATPDNEDRIGPWEDPVVQRATELGLGVIHPRQLDLNHVPAHSAELAALSRQIRLLLGMG